MHPMKRVLSVQSHVVFGYVGMFGDFAIMVGTAHILISGDENFRQ